ncbi:hypothetical protein QYF36_023901 [Acer negundo]|nr:hypothetical protein QYF36_023901 [Acer negundo]
MFNSKHLTFIEFELFLIPIDIQFPEDAPSSLLGFNQQNIGDPVEENYEENNFVLVEENFEEDIVVGDVATDGSVVDNDYQVNEESEDDSDVSLMNENGENYMDHYEGDGDERIVVVSSDEETALTRVATYCQNHQWAQNPNGTISFEAGQIFRFAKITREVIEKYAIQEGFTFKKTKNDRKFGGVLLSATAFDGDKNILHIAICICESKTSDSWSWFLRELRDSLGWYDRKKICFISDRQKGCVKALAKEWPEAYTRVANRGRFNQALDSIKGDSVHVAN